jgi:chromosome segregation ATPase
MENAIAMEDNQKPGDINYKSRFAQGYAPAALAVTPQDEAQILGEVKTIEKTYQSLENTLKETESEIKSIGLQNKSGVALIVYNTLDRLGLYPKERLIQKEIQKIDKAATKLDKLREKYTVAATEARNKYSASESTKYKAELLTEQYTGVMEDLEKELSSLKEDARKTKEQIRQGDKAQGLREKFIGFKNEIRNVKYDLKTLARKREKAGVHIIKSDGKTNVYRQNEIIRESLYDGISAQYDRLDILRERLKDLEEISKNNKGISLLDAVSMLKESEKLAAVGMAMAEKNSDCVGKMVRGLNEAQIGALPIGGDLPALEEITHDRQSQRYLDAQKIIQRDEDSDLV